MPEPAKVKSSNLSSNDTSNVPTPRAFGGEVVGASMCHPSAVEFQEGERKRYFDLFREAALAAGGQDNVMHSTKRNKIKVLRNHALIVEFEYTVENVKNYYCAYRLAGNDASGIIQPSDLH